MPTTDTSPDAGQKDHTTALFMHAPRPPKRADGKYGYQCRFGGNGKNSALDQFGDGHSIQAVVYRCTEDDIGSLRISTRVLDRGGADAEISMTADEMQTLACALLDAAHHLRTVPAAPYVWPATADAEAVPA